MPPVAPTVEARVLARGAAALGWATGPVPLLINTVPYGGRADCVQCGQCVGFACPTDAKNGSAQHGDPACARDRAVLAW